MANEKICKKCGASVPYKNEVCPDCGGSEFRTEETENLSMPEMVIPEQSYESSSAFQAPVTSGEFNAAVPVSENVVAGIVGAFLFSLIGAVLYFVVYQVGYVAGICGLVMFVLASFGYGIFSRVKHSSSKACLITSILVTIVMILIAEYVCLSYDIYSVYSEMYELTIFDAMRAAPSFLAESEVAGSVAQDLIFSYIMGGIAVIAQIRGKKKKAR